MSQDFELISLSELVAKVKSDLMSQVQGSDTPFLFVDGVEITAQVIAKREKGEGGKAGLSLSVLGFGADARIDSKTTIGHELTQSVTIKLSPILGKTEYVQQLSPDAKTKLLGTVERGAVRSQDDGTCDLA